MPLRKKWSQISGIPGPVYIISGFLILTMSTWFMDGAKGVEERTS